MFEVLSHIWARLARRVVVERLHFLFEKLRNRKIEKRNAQFLAYRELCIFVNKYF